MLCQRSSLARSLRLSVVLAAVTRAAAAQVPPPSGPPVTLSPPTLLSIGDAVREALDHNLELVAERYSVDIARARAVTAGLRPNPVLTVSAMVPDHEVYANAVSPREEVVRTDVVIEGGSKRARRIDVAERATSIAELQLLNATRLVVLDTQQACIELLQAKANLSLARDSLTAFNELVRVNAERVRVGDLAAVELARSRLAAQQFQNDVRQQESKVVIAQARLRRVLGRTGGNAIDVTGELRHDADPVDLDQLRQDALARRPDLEALRADHARTTADLRLQIAQGRIDYTLSAEVHHQRQPSPAAAAGNTAGLYLSVPLPLFNRNQGEILRARQEESQSAARTKALEAAVADDVVEAFTAYQAARDVVQSIEDRMLAQARDVRTTTEYSYRRGEASFVELLDAVRAFNDTMQNYNQARADYARSLYQIDSIRGASTSSARSAQVTP